MHNPVDTFVKDNLPSAEMLPEFLPVPGRRYARQLNASTYFVDRWVTKGFGDRPALRSLTETWSYGFLHDQVDRLAEVLTDRLDVRPGNRVLLRGRNSPFSAALHLAVIRVGAVVVSTMPMLRAGELRAIVEKARISHALCEAELLGELSKCQALSADLTCIATYSGPPTAGCEYDSCYVLEALLADASGGTKPYPTSASDPCLIAFTSGTTGVPKGAVHTHRDLLAVCDTFSSHILKTTADDVFCCSAPLAFTFGLGGLLLFPLRAGASAVLLAENKPTDLLAAVQRFRATICLTAPTAYRAMLDEDRFNLRSLRACVSAGETLPHATFDAFFKKFGIRLIDGIGSTEMLHIFISAEGVHIKPGATGKVIPGYEARVVDADGNEVPRGTVGWLAVKGPTGCRYLNDDRQSRYVKNGWNITGDAYRCDADGYFWYQSRMDDLIVSAGYNISAPEVEGALLSHYAVADCAVIGRPDAERGQIVKAFVVIRSEARLTSTLAKELQEHVKGLIAPFKYPRQIEFVSALPKTLTGKLKRFELRLSEAA